MAGAGGNAIVTYMNGSTGIMSQAQVTALEAEGGSGANSISSWAPYNGAAALGTVTAPNITSQTPGLQSSGTEMPGANVVATINANNPSSTLTNTQENSIVATRSAIIDQLNTGNIGNVTIAPSGTSFITTPSNLADKSVTTISTSPSGMITSVSPTATTTIINGVSSTINASAPTVTPITNTQDYYTFSDGSKVSQTQYDSWTDEQQFNYQKSIGGIPPDAVFIENKGGGWGYSKTDTSAASIADFTGKSPMVINPDGSIDIGKSLAKGVTADYIISHTTASMSDINQAQASNTVMGILNGSKYQQGDQYLVAQAVADKAITLSQANKAGFSVTQSDVDNAAKQELQTNSLQSLSKSGVVTISANGNEYAINWDKVTPSNYTDLENIGANFADMVKAQEASGFVGMGGNPTFSTAAANISGNKSEVWIPSIKGNTTTYTAETPNAGGIQTSGTELNVALANINSVLTDKSQKASDSGQVNELNRLIEDSGLWDNSKLGKTTYLGGQTFYTDSKGHVLTSQDQVNIMWNSLTPAQQSQIASNYNQKTNPFAELTIEEQESANQAGFVGQMVWNPVLGVTTPFAELSVGQHVSASQWENAAVTGLLDVSMIGGTNVLNSGSMFSDLLGSEKAASYLTGGLTTGAAAINLPNTIATVTNSKDTLEQKAMAVGGEVLISDTGLRELGMTTPSSFAQTYLIPKVSVDFAKIGNNLSNYATAMEGGIDEGISNPISIQAPKSGISLAELFANNIKAIGTSSSFGNYINNVNANILGISSDVIDSANEVRSATSAMDNAQNIVSKSDSVLLSPEDANAVQVAQQRLQVAQNNFVNNIKGMSSISADQAKVLGNISGYSDFADALQNTREAQSTLTSAFNNVDKTEIGTNEYAQSINAAQTAGQNLSTQLENLNDILTPPSEIRAGWEPLISNATNELNDAQLELQRAQNTYDNYPSKANTEYLSNIKDTVNNAQIQLDNFKTARDAGETIPLEQGSKMSWFGGANPYDLGGTSKPTGPAPSTPSMPSLKTDFGSLDRMWNVGGTSTVDSNVVSGSSAVMTRPDVNILTETVPYNVGESSLKMTPIYGATEVIQPTDLPNLEINPSITANPSMMTSLVMPLMIPVVTKTLTEWEAPSLAQIINPQKLQSKVQTLTTQQATQTEMNPAIQIQPEVESQTSLQAMIVPDMSLQQIMGIQPQTAMQINTEHLVSPAIEVESATDLQTQMEQQQEQQQIQQQKQQTQTQLQTATGTGTTVTTDNPPPEEINPDNFLFFPPEKKKDKKKNKKTKNEKQTIQQYQYLFSKTPELNLHMPTGSQLTKGGILGGELAERRVTTVEPSHNVEEGVKITTRTYNRTRGKRSTDYRGITRTNLAVA